MTKKAVDKSSEQKTTEKMTIPKFVALFIATVGAAVANSIAIGKFWESLSPKSVELKIFGVFASICLCYYLSVGTKAKFKNWRLVN